MITPPNPVTQSAATFDGLYVTSIQIQAPNPSRPIQAFIRIAPYNTTTLAIAPQLSKSINFMDVVSASAQYPVLANALAVIEDAVQQLVTSQSLFATPTSSASGSAS